MVFWILFSSKSHGELFSQAERFVFTTLFVCILTITAKNTVMSHDFLMWKFCGKAQFPHSFGRIARNYAETMPCRKISTPGNQVKLRYFSQWIWLLSNMQVYLVRGPCVESMSKSYNRIRLSLSTVNYMAIKILIRYGTITKCFSFYQKRNFDFTTIFCGTALFSNALILNVWSIFWAEGRNLYFYEFFTLLSYFILQNTLLLKFENKAQIFIIIDVTN